MKVSVMLVIGAFLIASSVVAAEKQEMTLKEKQSYAIGINTGKNFKRSGIDIDPEMLLRGIKDAQTGATPLFTDQEMMAALAAMQKDMQAKMKSLADKNKKDGEAFLASNKKKKGVKVLPSGLQYRVIKAGAGKSPKETDTVTVHYKGTLIDGTEFDSSHKRNQPATFPVNSVIKGWKEALPLMKEGATWELVVPSTLAYGEQGTPGGPIGPNSVLIFEVELISVQGKE
ncbi:MAG: FKBP-type peptidyl-prolyl cis-trans isomerase [Nitrospirota bacterium]